MTAAILDRSPAPPPQLSGAVEAAGSRGYGHFGPTSTLAYTTTTSSPPPLTALAPTGTTTSKESFMNDYLCPVGKRVIKLPLILFKIKPFWFKFNVEHSSSHSK